MPTYGEVVKVLDFIEKLRNESFVGWHEEAINGYLTALKTLEEKFKADNNARDVICPRCKSDNYDSVQTIIRDCNVCGLSWVSKRTPIA